MDPTWPLKLAILAGACVLVALAVRFLVEVVRGWTKRHMQHPQGGEEAGVP